MTLSFLCHLPSPRQLLLWISPLGWRCSGTPASTHSCMGSEPCGQGSPSNTATKSSQLTISSFPAEILPDGLLFFCFGLYGERRLHHLLIHMLFKRRRLVGGYRGSPHFAAVFAAVTARGGISLCLMGEFQCAFGFSSLQHPRKKAVRGTNVLLCSVLPSEAKPMQSL